MARTLYNTSAKRTNYSNTRCATSTGNVWNAGSSSFPWAPSLKTGLANAKQISKITFQHYHTITTNSGRVRNLRIYSIIPADSVPTTAVDGSSNNILISNTVACKWTSATVNKVVNTFTFTSSEEDASLGQYTVATGIKLARYMKENNLTWRLRMESGTGSGDLYSRGDSSDPMVITVYYYDVANEPRIAFFGGEDNPYSRSVSDNFASFSIPVNFAITGDPEGLTEIDTEAGEVQTLKMYYTTNGTIPTRTNSTVVESTTFPQRSPSFVGSLSSASAGHTFTLNNIPDSESVNFMIEYVYGPESDVIYCSFIGKMPNIPMHLSGTGNGVSFGGYSSATPSKPMLESYYPAYLYGGVMGVTAYPAVDEEIVVGVWMDGKPIYARGFEVSFKGTNSTTAANVNILTTQDGDIDNFIGSYGISKDLSTNTTYNLNVIQATTNYRSVYFSAGTAIVVRHAEGNSNNITVKGCVLYTKTTDEATV